MHGGALFYWTEISDDRDVYRTGSFAAFFDIEGYAISFVQGSKTGGVDTGWTFYTPYSVETNTSVISMTLVHLF